MNVYELIFNTILYMAAVFVFSGVIVNSEV